MNRRSFLKSSAVLAAFAGFAPMVWVPTRTYANKFDILSPEDIEEHFDRAPKPVFKLNGVIYCVKTWHSRLLISERHFLNGDWRKHAIPFVVKEIRQHERVQNRFRPGITRYHVFGSQLFNWPRMKYSDEPKYCAWWRAARVTT